MVIRFGIFELDAQSGELRRHGQKIRLPDQSFQILRLLLERPDQVVTREELRQRLWTSDTSVDFDGGLNSAMRKLREALDDSAENPRFVETLPRRGYRFIGFAKPAVVDDPPEPVPALAPPRDAGAPIRRGWIAGGLLFATAIAAVVFIYRSASSGQPSARPTAGHIQSLAVLPFDNLTGDTSQEYFVDGVTDALTTDLAEVGGFDVIARASAMRYKGGKKPLPVIGRELNVDALLAGAIVRSGHHVRITAQLSQAATERVVWAQSYEGELSDMVAVHRKIARAVAVAVRGPLGLPLPVHGGQPLLVNPAAYDAYLKGIAAAGRPGVDGFRTAVAYFEEAVSRQPDFAAAYAAMGAAQLQYLYGGPLSPRAAVPKAEASTRKALALDESLAQAHRTLAEILQVFYWKWDEAEQEFRRFRELRGNLADSPRAELLRQRRFDEALADAEHALRLDPLSFGARVSVAVVHRAAGEYDRAIADLRRALEIFPDQPRGHFQLGVTFALMGRTKDAIAELETSIESARTRNPRFQAYLAYTYAVAGRPLDARRILNDLEALGRQQYVSSFGLALVHDALGEKEPALAAIERAYQDRAVEFAQTDLYPPFRTIASEPRFQTVVRLVGARRND